MLTLDNSFHFSFLVENDFRFGRSKSRLFLAARFSFNFPASNFIFIKLGTISSYFLTKLGVFIYDDIEYIFICHPIFAFYYAFKYRIRFDIGVCIKLHFDADCHSIFLRFQTANFIRKLEGSIGITRSGK